MRRHSESDPLPVCSASGSAVVVAEPRRLAYRPDVDGLRALAIGAVVLYHAFPAAAPGGFVGVDVFFVVSGFLISGIIFDRLDAGRFRFSWFYARRVRRLFPALSVVLFASLAVGWWTLLSSEFSQLGRHVAAGAGFVANLAYWRESGYFDADAASKPLLHLWSLGVEEQFYLIWPVLLVLAWNSRRGVTTLIAVVLAGSFFVNVASVSHHALAAAFYSPLGRLWEPAIGSAWAWREHRRNGGLSVPTWMKQALAGSGLLTIIVSSYVVPRATFPGWWALLPTVGTMSIISAGPQAWINRVVLSNGVLVAVGLISYPLYLWHWPLLSFAAAYSGSNHGWIVVSAAVVLAWITYRLVEIPIRHGPATTFRVSALSVCVATLAVVGLALPYAGIGTRLSRELRAMAEFHYDYERPYRLGRCFLNFGQSAQDFARECVEPQSAARPRRVLVWGDSHAAALAAGVRAVFGGTYAIGQLTAAGCAPIVGATFPLRNDCAPINSAVLARIHRERFDRIILAANWSAYDFTPLGATIEAAAAAGTTVVVIGQVPRWFQPLPRTLLLFHRANPRAPHQYPERLQAGFARDGEIETGLRRIAAQAGAEYISAYERLCDRSGCIARLGADLETLTFWDTTHLTERGATFLAEGFQW